MLTAVQAKTKEDEIHQIIAEVEAGGNGLRRENRSTRFSRGTAVEKVDPRKIGENEEEVEEEEEEEDDDKDENYQQSDDSEDDEKDDIRKEDNGKKDDQEEEDGNKQDDDREKDGRRDDEWSDEESDYGGDYGGDHEVNLELASSDYEAEDDNAKDNEEDAYYELEDTDYESDQAPHSTPKPTQYSSIYSENEILRILEERHLEGEREYLVDWHPTLTPRSSLPTPLLDEWTNNPFNHTTQHAANTAHDDQHPIDDEEDALI